MSLVLEHQVKLSCEYDEDDDTLYAWIGEKPREAITYETKDGHLVRLDPETKEFVGVTIFDFEAKWSDEGIALEWEAEVEQSVPWIPSIARKRRETIAERRVLHRVGPAADLGRALLVRAALDRRCLGRFQQADDARRSSRRDR